MFADVARNGLSPSIPAGSRHSMSLRDSYRYRHITLASYGRRALDSLGSPVLDSSGGATIQPCRGEDGSLRRYRKPPDQRMAVGLILNEIWKSKWKFRAKWTQDDNGLTVQMPESPPNRHAMALQIART